MTDDTAYAWSVAFEKARDPACADVVSVPRSAEAALPPTMELERSPPPLSLRCGADAVYRQADPDEHYVVREYRNRWTVTVHERNPHHAPLGHVLRDVQFRSLLAGAVRRLVGAFGRSRRRKTPAPERQ